MRQQSVCTCEYVFGIPTQFMRQSACTCEYVFGIPTQFMRQQSAM